MESSPDPNPVFPAEGPRNLFAAVWHRIGHARRERAEFLRGIRAWNGEKLDVEKTVVDGKPAICVRFPARRFVLVALDVSTISHHLRAALDGLVFAALSPDKEDLARKSEFPVFEKPTQFQDWSRAVGQYLRPSLADVCEQAQPYRHPLPDDSALRLLHDLNRFDKHRLLQVVQPSFCDADQEFDGSPTLASLHFRARFPPDAGPSLAGKEVTSVLSRAEAEVVRIATQFFRACDPSAASLPDELTAHYTQLPDPYYIERGASGL